MIHFYKEKVCEDKASSRIQTAFWVKEIFSIMFNVTEAEKLKRALYDRVDTLQKFIHKPRLVRV